jgi:hypothetical protein
MTGDFVDVHKCFVYPLQVGNWTSQGYGNILAIDTCIIKNVHEMFGGFNDVIEINNTFNSFEHYAYTKTFFAIDVGVIRYEVPDSNKFKTLISYHLEP